MHTAPTGSTPNTPSLTGTQTIAENFDTFLTLLTTQLKFQDPLSPMDTTEFTNQLTQFSQVEQAIKTNAGLDSLLSAAQANQAVAALGYIGKEIEAESSMVQLKGGEATILYSLPENVAKAVITITDSSGKIIRTATAETTSGRHEFVWDGTNGQGTQQADGSYAIAVIAMDTAGEPIEGVLYGFSGIVDQVISEGGPVFLMVGEVAVPLDHVAAVRNPA